MQWQAVFFDFDGVILDSVPVKTRAFAEMYRPHGPAVEAAVVAYHLAHGGVSRFEKFRLFHREYLGVDLGQVELEAMGHTFEDLVLRQVLEVPFLPGALEALRLLKAEGIPAFVVSGTPDAEVRHIVEQRELAQFFEEVHGSPRRKPEILQDIFSRWSLDPGKTLFIGDATTDYEAAIASKMRFLGIVISGEPSPFPRGTAVSSEVRLVLN
jgi:phosphoglycolate phosphatase-like HAD superfamily hydrolase